MATTPSSLPSGPANGAPPLPTSVPLTPAVSFEDQIRAVLEPAAGVEIPATPPSQSPSAAPPAAPAEIPATPATPPLEEFDFDSQQEPPATDPAANAAPAGDAPPADPNAPAPPAVPDAASQVKELLAKETWTPEEEDRIRGAFLKTNNGKAMLDAKNFFKALEAPPEIDPQTGANKGGLGRRISREEILQGDTDSLAMMQLMHDFETRPANFLANFFGHRDASGQLQLRPGADVVIQNLPQHLMQADPSGQLHQRLATVAIAPYLEKIRATVVEMPQTTQQQAEAKLRRGQALNDLELTLFGEFTPIPGFDYGAGPHDPSKPDPLASERQRLADQQRQIQTQQQQAQQAHYEGIANTIEQEIESSVRQDAIRILSQGGLKNAYPEAVFNGLVDQFILEVFERTSGNPRQGSQAANPRGFQAFNIQIDRAARGRMDRSTPVTTYRRMAQEVMRNSARPYLEKVIAKAQAGSDALHQRAAAAANRSEVPPGSAPAGAPPAASAPSPNSLIRPAGADPDKWMEETIRTQMLGGAAAAAIRH